MTQQWECWAYVSPKGRLITDTRDTEAQAWCFGLGYPGEAEIQAAKQRGARVIRVRIEEIENGQIS